MNIYVYSFNVLRVYLRNNNDLLPHYLTVVVVVIVVVVLVTCTPVLSRMHVLQVPVV